MIQTPIESIESDILLDDETIDTTIDVDVDELCTITVANKPNIRPAMGLDRIAPSVNALPVILPNSTSILY